MYYSYYDLTLSCILSFHTFQNCISYITGIFLELARAANILLAALRRYCTEVPDDKKDLLSMNVVENRLCSILEAKENTGIAGQRRSNSLTANRFIPKYGQLLRKNTV